MQALLARSTSDLTGIVNRLCKFLDYTGRLLESWQEQLLDVQAACGVDEGWSACVLSRLGEWHMCNFLSRF
jgi:hypothetical protein